MTTEGSYIYACPIPGEPSQDPVKVIITSTPYGQDIAYQSLIDTVAAQRQEIEMLKQALELSLSYMTASQRESLRYMATLLAKE